MTAAHDRLSFEPLTPLLFLGRLACVFPGRSAVVSDKGTVSYAELRDRAWLLAGSLHELGVDPGDRAAALAPNTPLLLEAQFVTLVDGAEGEPDELIAHAKQSLARFRAPKRVLFGPLPKTATGKIMKYELCERLWSERESRTH